MGDVQVHWFSIVNSIVVVFFLAGNDRDVKNFKTNLFPLWTDFLKVHCDIQKTKWTNTQNLTVTNEMVSPSSNVVGLLDRGSFLSVQFTCFVVDRIL